MLGRRIQTGSLMRANILSTYGMPLLNTLYSLFHFIPRIILKHRDYYYFRLKELRLVEDK